MQPAEILTDATFSISRVTPGSRRALIFNPPVYDAQYWARWSQPAGLLRLASLLKQKGYKLDLVDCMETDAKGLIKKVRRRNDDGSLMVKQRDDITKIIWHHGFEWTKVKQRLAELDSPDEIWVGSIMTYWWESTRDAVTMLRRVFPKAKILVGGIYPTLAPEHASHNLGADFIFKGEIKEASHLWTDLSLYDTKPTYSILTTSRGCPWDCNYCAARSLNDGSNKMRIRTPEDVLNEIEYKMKEFGIRHFGFYEDNALATRGHLQSVLELIIEREHKLELYAPEGFETRMLTEDLLRVMKLAGFRKIHLPFEALKVDTNINWNRRHASTASFDRALQAAINAGFKPRTEEINAFVLFGLPDDSLEDIMDSILYVHHTVGSIIPMLFTPVPGTNVYREYKEYLHREMEWDLHDLNGKFLPFLEHNQKRYPNLRASDYLQVEALMSILNDGKFMSRSVNLCGDTVGSKAFRNLLSSETTSHGRNILQPPS